MKIMMKSTAGLFWFGWFVTTATIVTITMPVLTKHGQKPVFAVRWSEDGNPALKGKRATGTDASVWGNDLFNVGILDNEYKTI